jgi:hypothetical protein
LEPAKKRKRRRSKKKARKRGCRLRSSPECSDDSEEEEEEEEEVEEGELVEARVYTLFAKPYIHPPPPRNDILPISRRVPMPFLLFYIYFTILFPFASTFLFLSFTCIFSLFCCSLLTFFPQNNAAGTPPPGEYIFQNVVPGFRRGGERARFWASRLCRR